MRQIIGLLFILIAAAFAGCNDSKPINSEENQEVSTVAKPSETPKVPPQASLTGDTISMNGAFALFYGPAEGDSAITSFIEMSTNIIDSLNKNTGIYAQYTTVNNFRVYNFSSKGSMTIMRSTFSEPVGVLVSDGLQSPQIKKGFANENDYKLFLSRYFIRPS